jgi:hypothetical protein
MKLQIQYYWVAFTSLILYELNLALLFHRPSPDFDGNFYQKNFELVNF